MGASPLPIFFLGLAILDEIFDSIRKIWTGQTVYATTTAAAGQITGGRRSRGTLRSTHSNPRPSCTHKHTITLRVDSVHPWTRYSVPLLKEYYRTSRENTERPCALVTVDRGIPNYIAVGIRSQCSSSCNIDTNYCAL